MLVFLTSPNFCGVDDGPMMVIFRCRAGLPGRSRWLRSCRVAVFLIQTNVSLDRKRTRQAVCGLINKVLKCSHRLARCVGLISKLLKCSNALKCSNLYNQHELRR